MRGLNVQRSMRLLWAAAGAALLACSSTGWGENHVPCAESLDTALRSNTSLTIDSRPAGIEVVGTDKDELHVTCTADDDDSARHAKLRWNGGKLTVSGTYEHHGGLEVRVEVPRRTNLRVMMPAGEVEVENVAGDKDIDLYAGQITILANGEWDYRGVDASVDIGEVKASAYGVDKGGFFRSFTNKNAGGEYRLHAHVMTGEVDLIGQAQPE